MQKFLKYSLLLLFLSLNSCSIKEPQDPEKVATEFSSTDNLDEKIRIFELFKETNPDSDELKSLLSKLLRKLEDEKGIIEAANYLRDNQNYSSSRTFNSVAWKIYETKENLELGAELAKKGTEIARKELTTAKETIPDGVSEEEWVDSKKRSLAMILDTYGSIEKEIGNNDNAIAQLKEAVDLTDESYSSINENYVSVIIKKGDYENAKSLLEKYISTGTNSDKMKSMLKDVYLKLKNPESNFPSYIAQFEEKARQRMIERLKNEIKNEHASNFELLDLNGEKVKLSDFKGSSVILDFWATWCGPCLQSFPGMKKAVEKFADNKKIKFLFINAWERVEDKKQNAIDFIKKNNYPFHVLMDDKNEVIETYGVRGIPTKFIIDKNQNIRFESIGYNGNTEELVDELSMMIKMIQ